DAHYVGLAQMARDYLIVQATSVSSKQMFSKAKDTITPLRNQLSEENICASLCLKTWYESGIIDNMESIVNKKYYRYKYIM
ncbi:10179_t:CDS:1, partial [Cetraspora pellucida]